MGNRRPVRAALAGAAVGGLMFGMVPARPAAAAGRQLFADSICTPSARYAEYMRVTGFGPNEVVHFIWVIYVPQGNVVDGPHVSFTTDANGAADVASISMLNEPFRFGEFFYHDNDGNHIFNKGDVVLANLTVNVDKPCTSYQAQPK